MEENEDDEDILVVNGDILTDLALTRFLESHRTAGTVASMVLVPYRSTLGVARIDAENRLVTHFETEYQFQDF